MNARLALVISAGLVMGTSAFSAYGYKLAPQSSPEERRLASITASITSDIERTLARFSVSNFTEPVHEEITNRIYGCNGDASICRGYIATTAPAPVLAGVRWNDDPPFRLSPGKARTANCKSSETIRFESQPLCWMRLFKDAEKGGRAGAIYGPGDAMIYRTHFGDLQFLHAMATRDMENAGETKARILDWFEFTWRSSRGEYSLDSRLREIDIPTIRHHFGKTEWRLQDLYTQGATGGLRRDIDDVAFGSLLHTLQDSYAMGHVDREESSGNEQCVVGSASVVAPGAILSFHAYGSQNHSKHAAADSRASFMRQFQDVGNVVDVGRALIKARHQNLPWSNVSSFFDCILTLSDPNAVSGPGDY